MYCKKYSLSSNYDSIAIFLSTFVQSRMTVVQQELNSDLGLKPVPSHIEEVEMDGVVEPELLPSEDKRLLRRIDC